MAVAAFALTALRLVLLRISSVMTFSGIRVSRLFSILRWFVLLDMRIEVAPRFAQTPDRVYVIRLFLKSAHFADAFFDLRRMLFIICEILTDVHQVIR